MLNLISFASRDATESLARDISALGYSYRVRSGAQWAVSPPPAVASVLLLDGGGAARPRPGELISRMAPAPWLCVSEAGRGETAEALMRAATEFVEAPWSRRELGLRLERLVARMPPRPEPDGAPEFARLGIVAEAPSFLRVLAEARRAARSVAPLTIQGETGTGKELVARAVHAVGPRAKQAFVPVNCGCLPPELVEERALRPRGGGLYRRRCGARRAGATGARGNAVSGRGRCAAAPGAGGAAALPAAGRGAGGGRRAYPGRRRAGHRGEQRAAERPGARGANSGTTSISG